MPLRLHAASSAPIIVAGPHLSLAPLLADSCGSCCSAPGAWIDVMEREFSEEQTSEMKLTGTHLTAFNLSSYNYLGFAESDLEMRDEVCEVMNRLGVSNASSRTELGTTDAHKELEARVAEFVGKPAALIFGLPPPPILVARIRSPRLSCLHEILGIAGRNDSSSQRAASRSSQIQAAISADCARHRRPWLLTHAVTGMGFATNSTVLPTLVGSGGLILSDELNHSSIVVGARGSAARIQVFKHNCPVR